MSKVDLNILTSISNRAGCSDNSWERTTVTVDYLASGSVGALTRRQILQLASLAAVSSTIPQSVNAEQVTHRYGRTIANARAAIAETMKAGDVPAVTIALTDGRRSIWAEAFGVIDKATAEPAQTSTLFCIGSCSKVVAAAAVMILVDRGKLELDAPVVRYLPDFKMASPEFRLITVRMLLNHASGFPGTNYRNSFTSAPHLAYQEETMEALKGLRLKHKPGEFSVYCNDGFTVAERLISRVSRLSYPDFVTQALLRPLGMTRSRYALQAFSKGSYAPGYIGGAEQPMEFVNLHGSGGLYSTPDEMTAFLRMLLNNGMHQGRRILSAASIAEMAVNQTTKAVLKPIDIADGYGLGWDGVRHGGFSASGITAWHKSGGTSVYSSFMIVLPGERLAIITSGASPAYDAAGIAEYVLNEALVEAGRLRGQQVQLQAADTRQPNGPTAESMEGIYAYHGGVTRIARAADGSFQMFDFDGRDWSSSASTLQQQSDGSYALVSSPDTSFRQAKAADTIYLTARGPYGPRSKGVVEVPYLQKMRSGRPLKVAWQQRFSERWLLVNEMSSSLIYALAPPTLSITQVPGLPGYVVINSPASGTNNQLADASESDRVARMCLRIPVINSRDLNDLRIIPKEGREWVSFGNYVFQPESAVPALKSGSISQDVGSAGYGIWLRIHVVAGRSLRIRGATAWKLFDGNFGLISTSEQMSDPELPSSGHAQYFLLSFGAPRAKITVVI